MGSRSAYETEIREQPEVLRRLLDEGRAEVEALAADIQRAHPAYGLFAARGSSDNAARYGKYVFGIHNRLTCALAAPSVISVYGTAPDMAGALAIGIRQSGQSPDIVCVIDAARRQGALTVALTNQPDSPLARASEHTVQLRAGVELAIAATKTYTAELMAIAMISAAMAGDEVRWAQLNRVPDHVQATIDDNSAIAGLAAFREMQHLCLIGRGYNYSTAFETGLKIKETSYLVAEPYSLPDLLHGPVSMIGAGFPIVLVAPRGHTDVDLPKILETVESRHARLIAITDNDESSRARRSPSNSPQCPSGSLPSHALWGGSYSPAAWQKSTDSIPMHHAGSTRSRARVDSRSGLAWPTPVGPGQPPATTPAHQPVRERGVSGREGVRVPPWGASSPRRRRCEWRDRDTEGP